MTKAQVRAVGMVLAALALGGPLAADSRAEDPVAAKAAQGGPAKEKSSGAKLSISLGSDDDEDADLAAGALQGSDTEKTRALEIIAKNFGRKGHGTSVEDIVIPIGFFLFLLALILGSRALRERTKAQRLELLKLMVEKGQPIPDQVLQQAIGDERGPDTGVPGESRMIRRGFSATIIGLGLLAFGLLRFGSHPGPIIAGIVLLGIGVGHLAARHFQSK